MERLEAESHQLAMIASTFANDELQLKKQTLQQYVVLTEDLKGENVKLREELKEQERESLQVHHTSSWLSWLFYRARLWKGLHKLLRCSSKKCLAPRACKYAVVPSVFS